MAEGEAEGVEPAAEATAEDMVAMVTEAATASGSAAATTSGTATATADEREVIIDYRVTHQVNTSNLVILIW